MERPIWWAFFTVVALAISGVIAWLALLKPFDKCDGEPIGFWAYVVWLVFNVGLAYLVYVA